MLASYPRQFDRRPRKLIQSCLRVYLRSDASNKISTYFGAFLLKESQKPVVATTNAFVLLEWCTLVEEELARSQVLNSTFLKQTVTAQALLLDKCLDRETRDGISHTALVLTRRGIRKLFQSPHCESALPIVVGELTSDPSLTPANASLLGVLAGVSVRLPKVKPQFTNHTTTIVNFYIKVVLGAKSALPLQQSHGLDEFLNRFVTEDVVSSSIIPTIEKAILRSPENVLQGPIVALAQSLPEDIDLSSAVATKLLKPILSSLASTNANVREGAAHSLAALLVRKQDTTALENVVKDLLGNVKASKSAAYELRGLICDCLKEVQPSEKLSISVLQGLLPIATKEANEGALRREISAIATHAHFALNNGLWTKELADPVIKGCNEKRAPIKKLWLTGMSNALLSLSTLPDHGPAEDLIASLTTISTLR